MPASKPNYPPKAPPPNAIALGFRALTYEWGGEGRGGTNIQSITILLFLLSLCRVFLGLGQSSRGREGRNEEALFVSSRVFKPMVVVLEPSGNCVLSQCFISLSF